ncbi:MAG: DUF4129 domain-containing protein [Thermodesulfobacteriota bacterium]
MRLYSVGLILALVWLCVPGPAGAHFGTQLNLPKDPDAVLEEVLSREEFRDDPTAALDRARERLRELFERLIEWLYEHFPRLRQAIPDMDTAWIVLGCLVLGAAIVLVCVLLKLVAQSVLDRSARAEDAELDQDAAAGLAFSSGIWTEAVKRANAGEFALAVILLFRYVLIKLDELGRLPYHPGRTNSEILATLRGNDPLRGSLARLVPIFNRVRYGNASCDRADFEHFRDRCVDLTQKAEPS